MSSVQPRIHLMPLGLRQALWMSVPNIVCYLLLTFAIAVLNTCAIAIIQTPYVWSALGDLPEDR